MIDGSGSIEQAGGGNFKRELNFVKQIVSAFEVSRDGTHVGIIIFSSYAKVCIYAQRFSSGNYELGIKVGIKGKVPLALDRMQKICY